MDYIEGYIKEVEKLDNWIKELNPITDRNKINKIQTVLDRMSLRIIKSLTA